MNILYHHRTQGKGVERIHILGIVNAWRSGGHNVDIVSPPGVSFHRSQNAKINNDKRNGWKYLTKDMPEVFFEFFEVVFNFWAFISLSRKIRRDSQTSVSRPKRKDEEGFCFGNNRY